MGLRRLWVRLTGKSFLDANRGLRSSDRASDVRPNRRFHAWPRLRGQTTTPRRGLSAGGRLLMMSIPMQERPIDIVADKAPLPPFRGKLAGVIKEKCGAARLTAPLQQPSRDGVGYQARGATSRKPKRVSTVEITMARCGSVCFRCLTPLRLDMSDTICKRSPHS